MNAPRITVADLEAEIASEHYFTAFDGALGALSDTNSDPVAAALALPSTLELLTFCVLVLRNGIKVTGESACVSSANFDAAIGRQIARANAVSKMWPLLGFRLADRIAKEPARDCCNQSPCTQPGIGPCTRPSTFAPSDGKATRG